MSANSVLYISSRNTSISNFWACKMHFNRNVPTKFVIDHFFLENTNPSYAHSLLFEILFYGKSLVTSVSPIAWKFPTCAHCQMIWGWHQNWKLVQFEVKPCCPHAVCMQPLLLNKHLVTKYRHHEDQSLLVVAIFGNFTKTFH